MYIPTTFFSEGEEEFLIASGGIETTWVSGSYLWKSHIFSTSGTGSFVVTSGNTSQAKVLLVGAGGSRGIVAPVGPIGTKTAGSGGGGGVIQFDTQTIVSGSYTVVVGSTYTPPTYPAPPPEYFYAGGNGSGSFFNGNGLNLSVLGGGGGGAYNVNGKSGGSGGGAGGASSPGSGDAGPPRQGYNGGTPTPYLFSITEGGAGGGAGATGGTEVIPTTITKFNGGSGRASNLYYGLTAYYGGGGYIGTFGSGSRGVGSIGQGQSAPLASPNGTSGIVVISYPYEKISTFRTELARFTPTIPTGTLEYVEAVTGELKQYTISSTASIDLCIVSGSQWNIYEPIYYRPTPSSFPMTVVDSPCIYQNGTKTTLSINSCS